MKKTSRKWFDSAYSFTEGIIPFGYLTGPLDANEIMSAWGRGMRRKEAQKLARICKRFWNNIPPEDDFSEEKGKIIPSVTERLSVIPGVKAVITFGWVVGDIDICLIVDEPEPFEEFRKKIPGSLITEYPMVDWEGIFFFRSLSGREFAERLFLSRFIAAGPESFNDPLQTRYVEYTLRKAKTAFGDESFMNEAITSLSDVMGMKEKAISGKIRPMK